MVFGFWEIVDFNDQLGYFCLVESLGHEAYLLSRLGRKCTLWVIGVLKYRIVGGPLLCISETVWNLNFIWNVLTLPSLTMVLRECMMSLMASAMVSIQIQRLRPSSHTKSSSIFLLMMMLMASKIEASLLIEHTLELMGIQSYAVFVCRISVMRFLRLCFCLYRWVLFDGMSFEVIRYPWVFQAEEWF